MAARHKIPEAAIKRLPVYLRVLQELQATDVSIVSSAALADRTGLSPEQIRKDLAYFGAFGTRGVGYDSALLSRRISRILGLTRGVKAALVGAGHLGYALARYSLSREQKDDVHIGGIFDVDPTKVGGEIAGVRIRHLTELPAAIAGEGLRIGIITVPVSQAQNVADQMASAGIEAILNFAPAKVKAPARVFVQNIDLTIELQSLAYYTSVAADDETDGE